MQFVRDQIGNDWLVGDCGLEAMTQGVMHWRLKMKRSKSLFLFMLGEDQTHEPDEIAHDLGRALIAAELVVEAVEALCNGILPLATGAADQNRAAIGKSPKHGGNRPDSERSACGDFAGSAGSPKVCEGEINAAFGFWHSVQMASEVFGMAVD